MFNLNVSITTIDSFQSKAQSKVVESTPHWKLPTFTITTGIDTEYVQHPDHPNTMITTQVALSADPADCITLEHPSLGANRLPTWDGNVILSTVLGWDEVENQGIGGYLLWENMMFFAPSDAFAGCFLSKDKARQIQRYCTQDARIRVNNSADKKHPGLLRLGIYLQTPHGVLEVVLKLLDFGKLAAGGLHQTVEGLGGPMPGKGLMDQYKASMLEPYLSEDADLFAEYVTYAQDDACKMFFLRAANKERTDALFSQHSLPTPQREIVTTGSLVASLFQSYIEKVIGKSKFYSLFEVKNSKGATVKWGLEDLLTKSTVKHFAEKKETNKAALALVQGGRAKNEQPMVIKQSGLIADIDLSGCYVTIQNAMTYPIGLPCVYGQHESSKIKLTLGEYLRKYGSELIDRLWTAVVTGKLNHRQTLVPSKVIDTILIAEKWNEDTVNIPADFRLYTNEVINGVITSDVLATLKNACTDREFSEYLKLEVTTAAWYPKSLQCQTAKECYDKTSEHAKKNGNGIETVVTKTGSSYTTDNRSRYWLGIPLQGFLAPYAETRKQLKKAMQNTPKGTSEHSALDAQQNAMKLVGNTNYGVLASPYFPVGNVVVANNITATARVAVWLTGTALGCVQTITDGGAYDLNSVRTWKDKKPSMNTLSLLRSRSLLDRKVLVNLGTKALGATQPWTLEASEAVGSDLYTTISDGSVIIKAKEGQWGALDSAALAHVKEYFRDEKNPLSILDVISYEHKDIYTGAVYHSQTNYQFTHATGAKKTKARGQKVKGKPYEGNEASTILSLFEDLRTNPNSVPPYKPQQISEVLKCNQANEMLESKTDNVYKTNDLLAGDSILKSSHLRPISLSMFHWLTDKQYKSWETTVTYLKTRTGYGLEQFFLNPDGTCRYEDALNSVQSKIDEGLDFLCPLTKAKSREDLVVSLHPFFQP